MFYLLRFIDFHLKLYKLESIIIYFFAFFATFGFFKKYRWKHKLSRKNDRLFIFGCGYSINNITSDEWNKIRLAGDTMSFNEFFHSNHIEIDYHIIRELEPIKIFNFPYFLHRFFGVSILNIRYMKFYIKHLKNNHRYNKTKYIFLADLFSGPPLLFYLLFRSSLNILGFYSNKIDRSSNFPISFSFKKIPHGNSTLLDCINLGFVMGYKEIVLVGVDLYDRRYFYLNENQTRKFDEQLNRKYSDIHNTAIPVVSTLKKWKPLLADNGLDLYVYNPKSLLNEVLPVFTFPEPV
jgi:hypothetical protein